jgi:hypothetical protein
MDMKDFFKQLSDNSENEDLYITPTTLFMWFVGVLFMIFATINGFF